MIVQTLFTFILFLLFSGMYLVDDYVLVAKDKHGYNVEQVWSNFKSLDLNLEISICLCAIINIHINLIAGHPFKILILFVSSACRHLECCSGINIIWTSH